MRKPVWPPRNCCSPTGRSRAPAHASRIRACRVRTPTSSPNSGASAMTNSTSESEIFSSTSFHLQERLHRQARHNPNDFAHFAFTDTDGSPLVQATVHCQLQDFLTCHSRALIELPRDHGKSVQLC